MAKKRITVQLPIDVRKDLDKFAGPRGLSRFVTEAVNEAVKRERVRKRLSDTRGR